MTAPDSQPRPSRPRHRLLLLALVATGFGLRLVYGMATPTPGRFWDERYTLDNVRAVYAEGTVAPVSGYYPSPAVSVPPALLLHGTEGLGRMLGRPIDLMDDRGLFSALAYRLMRGLQAFYGVLGIALAYAVGRHLDTPTTGLLAAALLAFMPWHIHASGYIKPDAQLVASILLAVLLALSADRRPTLGRHAATGVAVALAASAKLTGVLAAVPLAVAALARYREPRRLALAAWAGAVSFLAFVAINPYWRGYLDLIGGLRRDYAMRAGWTEMSRWQAPAQLGELVVGGYGLGWLGAALAVVGATMLAMRLTTHPGTSRSDRVAVAMLVVFPAVHAAVYTAQTPYFKGNNFLPVLVIVILFAAVGTARLMRRFRRTGRLGRAAAVALAATTIGVAAWRGIGYTYLSLIPTTEDLAVSFLHRHLGHKLGRVVFLPPPHPREPTWEGHRRLGPDETSIERIDDFAMLASARLSVADGVIAPAAAFEAIGPLADLRATAGTDLVLTVEPVRFAVRGPPLIAIVRRHRPTGDGHQALDRCGDTGSLAPARPVNDPPAGCFHLPAGRARARFNLVVDLAEDPGDAVGPSAAIDVAGRRVPLRAVGPRRFVSERFAPPRSPLEVHLPNAWPAAVRADASLRLLRWLPPIPQGTPARKKVPEPDSR